MFGPRGGDDRTAGVPRHPTTGRLPEGSRPSLNPAVPTGVPVPGRIRPEELSAGWGKQQRPPSRGTWKNVWVDVRTHTLAYSLIFPAMAVIILVQGYPILNLIGLSFQKYGLTQLIAGQGIFIGLTNYATIFRDPFFWQVLERTALLTVTTVVGTLVAGTLVALLLERVTIRVRNLITAGLIFVWATPVPVAIDIWQWMVDYEFGVVNWLLTQLHVFGSFMHH